MEDQKEEGREIKQKKLDERDVKLLARVKVLLRWRVKIPEAEFSKILDSREKHHMTMRDSIELMLAFSQLHLFEQESQEKEESVGKLSLTEDEISRVEDDCDRVNAFLLDWEFGRYRDLQPETKSKEYYNSNPELRRPAAINWGTGHEWLRKFRESQMAGNAGQNNSPAGSASGLEWLRKFRESQIAGDASQNDSPIGSSSSTTGPDFSLSFSSNAVSSTPRNDQMEGNPNSYGGMPPCTGLKNESSSSRDDQLNGKEHDDSDNKTKPVNFPWQDGAGNFFLATIIERKNEQSPPNDPSSNTSSNPNSTTFDKTSTTPKKVNKYYKRYIHSSNVTDLKN